MPPVIPSPAFAGPASDHVDIIVGNPDVAPTGMVRIAANGAGGTAQASVNGGAYAGIGGSGGAAPWFSNLANFARTIDATLLAVPLASECSSLSLELMTAAAAGSGVAAPITTKSGGVISVKSGVTANSFPLLQSRNGITEAYIHNMRTAHYACATLTKIIATAATFELRQCCLTDNATNVYIGGIQATSGVNYVAQVNAVKVDTGIALDVAAQRTLLMVADGTNVRFYIGDANGNNMVLAATIAQVNASTSPAMYQAVAYNIGTPANVEFEVDSIIVLTQRAG